MSDLAAQGKQLAEIHTWGPATNRRFRVHG